MTLVLAVFVSIEHRVSCQMIRAQITARLGRRSSLKISVWFPRGWWLDVILRLVSPFLPYWTLFFDAEVHGMKVAAILLVISEQIRKQQPSYPNVGPGDTVVGSLLPSLYRYVLVFPCSSFGASTSDSTSTAYTNSTAYTY